MIKMKIYYYYEFYLTLALKLRMVSFEHLLNSLYISYQLLSMLSQMKKI